MTESLGLTDALLVTVIGMLIVFFGLTVLIFLIKGLVAVTQNLGKNKKTKLVATKTLTPAQLPPTVQPEEAVEDDAALIAAITAAVACCMEAGTAFTVRRVRRVTNAAAWQRAGRDEQIASRL